MEKIRFTCFLPLITWASSLVHHGMIGSLKNMMLYNVDLTSIPPEHLASLTSCVTAGVYIFHVSGCDLVTIMDSVKSKVLIIFRQSLDSEETQALVRAMESGVEEVRLGKETTLDIRVLIFSFTPPFSCTIHTRDSMARTRAWVSSLPSL